MLGVHMLRMVIWDLGVVFKVCGDSRLPDRAMLGIQNAFCWFCFEPFPLYGYLAHRSADKREAPYLEGTAAGRQHQIKQIKAIRSYTVTEKELVALVLKRILL